MKSLNLATNLPEHPPSKIVTVSQMRQLEVNADAANHSFATMMQIAGRRVAEALVERFSPVKCPVLVLAGPGNNGGDGLVCAHQLHKIGIKVLIYLWRRQNGTKQNDDPHLGHITSLGLPIVYTEADRDLAILARWLSETQIWVDALLGTGNKRPIDGRLAEILTHARNAKHSVNQGWSTSPHVVAIECPSGLYCDTGEVDPYTLGADLTVTFAYPKWGHYQFPGTSVCGEIRVADIGIDPHLADDIGSFLLEDGWVRKKLPQRDNNSHKGTFGKVIAAVGCRSFPGAAYLACAAAGRVGAGLVTGAVPDSIWSVVASKLAEPTWLPLPTTASGHLDESGADQLMEAAEHYTTLIIGCGLGQTSDTTAFVDRLLSAESKPPMLIDADGLNCLSQLENWSERTPEQTIITPHPAEMARLCGIPLEDVRANRWHLALEMAAVWRVVVLLKGPFTVIAAPDGRFAVLPVATPALATAGTGDVLAGIIGGLMAQGLNPFEAGCVGSWIHGQAGQQCEDEIGAAGVVASDLLSRLPRLIKRLTKTS